MKKPLHPFIYWTPRVLSILFLLFLAMFSLDVFEEAATPLEIAVGLFMHNIPVLVLLVILIISWKHEIVGAIAFLLAGLAYVLLIFFRAHIPWYTALSWCAFIAGPAFLIGALFLIGWRKKRKTGPAGPA